jgi:hypothetical protein
MASAAISIADRLIQLASMREKNRGKYFKNFIEPLYLEGEQIAKDYMGLLTELSHRLDRANDNREVVEWLETKRTVLQPLRAKVRALIDDGAMEREKERDDENVKLLRKGRLTLQAEPPWARTIPSRGGIAWTRAMSFTRHSGTAHLCTPRS